MYISSINNIYVPQQLISNEEVMAISKGYAQSGYNFR